jgi:indole-3-glycerol phosphate synthase
MNFAEYMKRLQKIEIIIAECKQAAPADGEMIRDDIVRLFNEASSLEADTRYMKVADAKS